MARFVKGQSGNPKGAPKRAWTWSGVLAEAMEKHNSKGIPIKEAVAQALITQATAGNVVAIKELMNRMDGMPAQDVAVEGVVNIIIDQSLKK
jgi:hypothetical protein